jgi:hypothetical protein
MYLPAAASVRIVTFSAPSYNPPRAANRRYKRCVTKLAATVATVARHRPETTSQPDRRATRRSDRFGILGGTRPTVTRGRRQDSLKGCCEPVDEQGGEFFAPAGRTDVTPNSGAD